ncbi:MAG: sulfite exporter TauE/SafE family protein [Pseudomonadota bacterium]
MAEADILIITAASIAFLHTVLGPDHYLVFTAMGKARDWTLAKTLRITLYCGIGHVLGSVLLGAIGILIGAELARLVTIEGVRGSLAGWALLAFGLIYLVWGLRKAARSRAHSHLHAHDGVVHAHEHDHYGEHTHVHDQTAQKSITPWALFIVFVLGPCEALIPLFMYPAAQNSGGLVVTVALVFGIVTLATMLLGVAVTYLGIEKLRLPSPGRYVHAVAGASIVVCASAITFLGL